MDSPLHYDFRDVLIAPARALSAKRIFVMTLFLVAAIGIYDIFVYLAAAIDGEPLGTFWNVYGLLPLVWFTFDSAAAVGIYALGLVLSILALMLGFFGVSAIEVEQIRGNRFFSIAGAIGFSLRRFSQILLSELSILLFMLVILVLFLLLGLVTRIPYLGEWIYALTFLLPAFVIAIFTVFIFAVFQVSVILLPAAAAAERHGESFTAILETFSTIIRQPVRWLIYTAWGLVAAKACSWVYAYFCYRSVQFAAWATSITAGEKAESTVRTGLGHLPLRSDLTQAVFQFLPGVDWSFSIAHLARSAGGGTAGHVMGFMLFLIFASILGYFLAAVATAQARGYVVIRYLKDEYRIADEKPLFFEEEHVNEPVGGGEGNESPTP